MSVVNSEENSSVELVNASLNSADLDLTQEQLSEFVELLDNTTLPSSKFSDRVVIGEVVEINKKQDICVVDFALKSEAIVPLTEFAEYDEDTNEFSRIDVNVHDKFEFYIESFETKKSVLTVSRSKVKKERKWQEIKECHKTSTNIEGIVFARMKGGFCVDFDGNLAFLPASQARINFTTNGSEIIGSTQPFKVVNIDEKYQTGIVSYLAAREEVMADKKIEFLEKTQEGDIVEGIVKSITNYGAFVDLGIMDGLLHISDIVWNRISHPSEILEVGQKHKLKIVKIDHATKRLSLGLKQLTENPNAFLKDKYKPQEKVTKKVTNITNYGIFVELEPSVEGLIHVYEIDWSKERSMAFLQDVKIGDEVTAIILSIDISNSNKILLSRKQTIENPWKTFIENTKIGTIVEEAVIRKIESFRMIVSVGNGISGVVQIEDTAWITPSEENLAQYKEGQVIRVVYISGQYDERQPKINLSIKRLTESPIEKYKDQIIPGSTISAVVSAIDYNKIELMVFGIFKAYVKKAHISSSKSDQRSNRFAIGDRVTAKVLKFQEDNGLIFASIKKLEEEEKETMLAKYGDADSGATIGNIIGDALKIPSAKAASEKNEAAIAKEKTNANAESTTKSESDSKTLDTPSESAESEVQQ